jgi:hypothetical protein
MVHIRIPFVDKESRELAESGRDVISGEQAFWLEWWFLVFLSILFWAVDEYFHVRPFGYPGVSWFGFWGFFAAVWAGWHKFWDSEKRNSTRFSSKAVETTVCMKKGFTIPAQIEGGKQTTPELQVLRQGISHHINWVLARGLVVINRADGMRFLNEKHILSNTNDREVVWDELPKVVQEYLRTYRRILKIKFIHGESETERPILGTKFAYGDTARWAKFLDDDFTMDISLVAQREGESRARSAAERTGSAAMALARTSSRVQAEMGLKRVKKEPFAEESEQEEDEENGGLS